MKHVYPPRHPASLDAPTPAHGNAAGRAPAQEPAEPGRDQAAPPPRAVARKAQRDAMRGDAEAPQGGPDTPPR